MRKSKIPGKPTRIPSAFDDTIHRTERTANQKFVEWMNRIIKEKNLKIGLAEQETTGADCKQPDIVILESPLSNKALCVIELKQPWFGIFNEKELKEPAREKATHRKAKYFAISNFKQLIWYNTERVNRNLPEEEQIHDKYFLSEIENLDLIEEPKYKNRIIAGLERFLVDLYEVHTGKKAEPKQAIDDFLIFRLQEKVKTLSRYYRSIIEDKAHKEPKFLEELQNWFREQNWPPFSFSESDFDKVARHTAYLLINKILFYDLLQAKRPDKLDPLNIPEDLTRGGLLQRQLQGYFDYVLQEIDYETIYFPDFIDQTAFLEHKEVVEEIKELIDILKRYDFSKIGLEIIGNIFQRLIPDRERHNLGQYFTPTDVVDLILRFCLSHESQKVLDPACGAGTFLVRAYQHKKLMNQKLTHQDILKTLWGFDIAKFPAHLATINLALRDLRTEENYPQIIKEDFFNLRLGGREEFGKEAGKRELVGLGKKKITIPYPKIVDCIVGNPPYTRQEEIPAIVGEGYKERLIKNVLYDLTGKKKLAEISKRAGIHAYFFIHGIKFLQNGGRFGFIVSNSWLDVDWGKGLQEFFLKNYKIIAIIESKVERWFEEADINTCIVILEKCKNQRERDENLVRFVYLKKPLRYFIPPARDIWEKQLERLNEIDKLKKTILAHNNFYENEDLRIFPKSQKELWEEGLHIDSSPLKGKPSSPSPLKRKHPYPSSPLKKRYPYPSSPLEGEDKGGGETPSSPSFKEGVRGKYIGSKWGKYLRAPQIFFKILEKGKDKLVPLKEVAEVRFGIKTGANEFFYLTEEEIKRRGIEKEFWMHKKGKKWVPNYVIKSPRECKSIVVNPKDLKYRVLMIHKDKKDLKGTNVLKYIKEGERKGFHKRPTCASRGKWYDLGKWEPFEVLFTMYFQQSYKYHLNPFRCFVDHTMYECEAKKSVFNKLITVFFNSSVAFLYPDILGRGYGGGGAPTGFMVYEVERLPVLNPTKIPQKTKNKLLQLFRTFTKRKWGTIFSELGASSPEEVSLEKVKPDRRELDKIIMGDILGLTEDEQLEVYRAVIDLVKSRIEKARVALGLPTQRRKTKEGIDIDALVKVITDKIGDETLGKFYKEKVLSQKQLYIKKLPKPSGEIRIEEELHGWRLYYGKRYILCQSDLEARYLKIWLETGLEKIKVPKDKKYLKNILPELESLKTRIDSILDSYLSSITDPSLQGKIEHQVWMEVVG